MKLYTELAPYYFSIEKNHRDITRDVRFISEILDGVNNASILDIGCGTGEHLNLLNSRGYHCTGIDRSAEMLAQARVRFPGVIDFIDADMREFDFYNEFDLVMCLFGSLNYMLTDEEIDSVFWNIWRALKQTGTGVFEIWHSHPILKIQKKESSHVSTTHIGDTTITRSRGFKQLPCQDRTLVEVNYEYRISSHEKESTITEDRHVMRTLSLTECQNFLHENGFSIKNIYANFQKEPFNENSIRMIIVVDKE